MSIRPYLAYKPARVPWLARIPAHWDITRVRWLFHIKKRIAGTLGYDVFSITQQGFRIKNLNEGQLADDYSKYQVVEVGDFAMNSMDLITGGVDVAQRQGVTSPDYRVFALTHVETSHSRYFLYLFQKCLRERIFFPFGQGSSHLGRWRFPTDAFRDFQFPVPPYSEQRAIAGFLDSELPRIDRLVAEQHRLIVLLQEKRQALISHAVTKGLDADAPMKDSHIQWLGDVPAHWTVAPLKRLADIRTGVAKGKDNSGRATITVPYLRVANVQDGYLDLSEVAEIEIPAEELERLSLRAGDVLMNEGGDFDKLGRGCVWEGQISPCITQNHVFAVRPRLVSSHWLSATIRGACAQFYFMSRSKQSTNLASISSTNLMELPVLLPPAAEQNRILSYLTAEQESIDALASKAARTIELLEERRTALISAAVTGQIDVRHAAELQPA